VRGDANSMQPSMTSLREHCQQPIFHQGWNQLTGLVIVVRTDGKRPDGVSLAPWKSGHLLVWDTTCPDTFTPSYRAHATVEPGRVAAIAEDRKDEKYRDLPSTHWFCPIAIETMGAMGPRSLALLKRWGAESRLRWVRPSQQNTSCRDCLLRSRGETVPQFLGACKPDTILFFLFLFFTVIK